MHGEILYCCLATAGIRQSEKVKITSIIGERKEGRKTDLEVVGMVILFRGRGLFEMTS